MPNIKINGLHYNTEDLSEQGKAQLASLQFLEVQMQKIRQEIAVYQTANAVYRSSLEAEIQKAGIKPISEHTNDGDEPAK
tara:strand:- start:43 stop:282 length:240 start_codon:yes stop_codon:yes gene_type:complete